MSNWMDIVFNPLFIPLICCGIIAAIVFLTKRGPKAQKIAMFCVYILAFSVWYSIVDYGIMPTLSISPVNTGYDALKYFLYAFPIFLFLKFKIVRKT